VKLSELTRGIAIKDRLNFRDEEVRGIVTDSRADVEGCLFAAIKGHSSDGHNFVGQAADRGAKALIVEKPISSTLPTLVVDDSAAAAALIAKTFYGDPASGIVLAGVSGTNGKTSTCFLLRSILSRALGPTGIIGTVGFGTSVGLAAATHTTPASVDLYRIIARFAAEGCAAVVMEVSSHATVQKRIVGLEFDVGVFTNITRDHLDYHGTFREYAKAKELFARTLIEKGRRKAEGRLVYNRDDSRLVSMANRFSGSTISFGTSPSCDVRAECVHADLNGTAFDIMRGATRVPVKLQLLGSFSVYNALAAAAAAEALGIGLDDIAAGLEEVAEVPGRFQVLSSAKGPKIVVDYAHTPDALESLLSFCRELGPQRLLTVFGCGGDRDRGKRPQMGRIAAALSDIVYITDDNPRTEDPDRIVREILEGMKDAGTPYTVIRDRRSAIRSAVEEAGNGDLVVLAGKGHEKVQIVGDRRIPFCDADEARAALDDAEVEHQT
jgi:UDP-N-acetylmuramoyl-L-alanyl-D-glutamate--2,6-diaminopimelate ligase